MYICRDQLNGEDWERTHTACFNRMYAKAVALGGLLSGEYGISYAMKRFLRRQ